MDVESAPLTSKGSPRFQIRYESSAPAPLKNGDLSLNNDSLFVKAGQWTNSVWKGRQLTDSFGVF